MTPIWPCREWLHRNLYHSETLDCMLPVRLVQTSSLRELYKLDTDKLSKQIPRTRSSHWTTKKIKWPLRNWQLLIAYRSHPRCLSAICLLANENFECDSARIPQLLDEHFFIANRYICQSQVKVADAWVINQVQYRRVFTATLAQQKAWKVKNEESWYREIHFSFLLYSHGFVNSMLIINLRATLFVMTQFATWFLSIDQQHTFNYCLWLDFQIRLANTYFNKNRK